MDAAPLLAAAARRLRAYDAAPPVRAAAAALHEQLASWQCRLQQENLDVLVADPAATPRHAAATYTSDARADSAAGRRVHNISHPLFTARLQLNPLLLEVKASPTEGQAPAALRRVLLVHTDGTGAASLCVELQRPG